MRICKLSLAVVVGGDHYPDSPVGPTNHRALRSRSGRWWLPYSCAAWPPTTAANAGTPASRRRPSVRLPRREIYGRAPDRGLRRHRGRRHRQGGDAMAFGERM